METPQIGGSFRQACAQYADRVAVVDDRGRQSYAWLFRQACGIADALQRRSDFKPGQHVGLHLPNSPEYVAGFYGILLAGGVVVPLPSYHKTDRIRQLMELADLDLLIDAPRSDNAATCSYPSLSNPQTISLNRTAAILPTASGRQHSDDVAMMLFTSGSTGEPKAVMLSHRNVLANARSIGSFLPIDASDRTLAIMPFAHALGNSVLQTHILSGAQLIFNRDLQFPTAIRDALQEHQCTSLTGVPEVFEGLLLAVRGSGVAFPHLRYLAVAGGRMDGPKANELAAEIAPAEFYVMYGQTEATARLAYLPPQALQQHADTIGQAIPGVELAVLDDDGQPAARGRQGTLYARGDNIMLGYWRDPGATSRVLQDGWLNTGDLACLDEHGWIRLCGRANGLIKVQGYRFHPCEVEQLLGRQLMDVQLVATPMELGGRTRLALFARSRSDRAVTPQEIRQACLQLLPRHMMPHRYEIVDDWPLNAARKIDRLALCRRLSTTRLPETVSSLT